MAILTLRKFLVSAFVLVLASASAAAETSSRPRVAFFFLNGISPPAGMPQPAMRDLRWPVDTQDLRAQSSDLAMIYGSFPPHPRPRPAHLREAFLASLPTTMEGQNEKTCLQIALYHEARGEPEVGQQAVASVILQRAKMPDYFGDGICGVITKKNMFSFVRDDLSTPRISEVDAWFIAGRIAQDMIDRGPLSDLKGADHFHARSTSPRWSQDMIRVKSIGVHIFYADPSLDYPS